MLTIERRKQVLERLKKERQVLVSDLCRDYGVLDETIRRDLRSLEVKGTATRTYGGAVLSVVVTDHEPDRKWQDALAELDVRLVCEREG